MNQKELQETLDLAQTVLGQWLRYRQYFLKGTSEEPITPEDEQEFLETTSAIAKNVRRLGQRVDDKQFPFRRPEIAAQLKGTISIQSFRNLAVADRRKFYEEWHTNLVWLTRTVGGLKFLNEGYRPPQPKRPKGKSGKKGGIKNLYIVIAVIALVLIGGYFLYMSI